jgi:Protein of unknown function (DUF3313)
MYLTDFRCRMEAPRAIAALLVLFLAPAGCSTVETQSFTVSKSTAVESAQVATDADFARYDRLLAEDMGIYYPPAANPGTDAIARLRKVFRDAFLDELGDYAIVREPGPSTMSVQATLIDLRGASAADIPALRRDVREAAKSGSLVFLMEMKDSQTGRVLARAADSANTPALATTAGATTDWQAVDDAARHWASLFRQFLDNNLGK